MSGNNNQQAILYSFRRCPYAMRARLAISNLEEPVELREVVLRDKPQSMIDVSPKATVPVLIEPNGNVIDESMDIMAWALAKHDPENWLLPEIGSLEEMQALIHAVDTKFKPHLDRYKYANRYEEVDGEAERQACLKFLLSLDKKLEGQSFLFGSNIALADMAVLPFVRQFANVDREWFGDQPWPHLLHWLEAFLASDRFLGIMQKYDQWKPDAAPVYFGGNL